MSPPEDPWDLVVVGAGPAGSAAALAALAADPALRVLLMDRASFPRDKPCGDGIAPHVFDALATVGVHDVADGWTPLRGLTLSAGGTAVAGTMARPAWVIPREVFDARLVAHAVAAGAVLARHKASILERRPAGLLLDGRIRGQVLVGADGAHSIIRRTLCGPASGRRALAIRGYLPTTPELAGRQLIRYGGRRQPAYAWAFDRGDGLANVGYGELLPAEPGERPTRRLMLDELDRLVPGAASGGAGWRAHPLPLHGWRWRQPDGPVLLAGDAAGLVNPMTGEGIYYAVATGILAGRAAARAVAAHDPAGAGALHRRTVRRLLARHLRDSWAAARMSAVPSVVEAGLRGAARDPRVFDDLVELGLADGHVTARLARPLAAGLTGTRRRC